MRWSSACLLATLGRLNVGVTWVIESVSCNGCVPTQAARRVSACNYVEQAPTRFLLYGTHLAIVARIELELDTGRVSAISAL